MMELLQIIWFVLWGILWAVYFMLDGFVLGTGMLYNHLGRTDEDKKMMSQSVGPVWNGNEVWLLTAGGATFAAFPTAYALMFSNLYSALLMLLFALIFRGVSLEFRNQVQGPTGRRAWDSIFMMSSLLIALLLGVAFGNIFQGLPMDAQGYHGSLIGLLNPYGLITGILFVLFFLEHGALYTAVKTSGELSARARDRARLIWPVMMIVAVIFLSYSAFATNLYRNYFQAPILLVLPIAAVSSLFAVRILLAKDKAAGAFAASCIMILMVAFTGIAGLFPNLIPSNLDPLYSLTIYNSSSSRLTLTIMTAVALIIVPVVISYKIWVYRIFSRRLTTDDLMEEEGY